MKNDNVAIAIESRSNKYLRITLILIAYKIVAIITYREAIQILSFSFPVLTYNNSTPKKPNIIPKSPLVLILRLKKYNYSTTEEK